MAAKLAAIEPTPADEPAMTLEDVMQALADASTGQDKHAAHVRILTRLLVDSLARLYIIECNMNTRDVGILVGVPQRTVGGATKATYFNVYKRIYTELLKMDVDDGSDTPPA